MAAESLGAVRHVLVALAAGGGFAFAAYRLRLLTPAAALVGGGLGASLIGLGGAAWAVPALVFFGSAAMLSQLPAADESASEASAEEGPRTVRQVMANGGIAWGLLLAAAFVGEGPTEQEYARPFCFWGFTGAFAAAAADTWATEVGQRYGGAPRSLRTGRRVPKGTSGAASVVGTLASLVGALVVSVSAMPFAAVFLLPGASRSSALLAAAVAGVAGAFTDSLVGAFAQARYRHAQTGARTEWPRTSGGVRNQRLHGVPGLTNDGVNALCTVVGAAGAMAGIVAFAPA